MSFPKIRGHSNNPKCGHSVASQAFQWSAGVYSVSFIHSKVVQEALL
ncbi:hypothetical protein VFA_003409 [Vibrio furnissii CIP 102972]|nr:hypothetical protein VFA_003409 [Vibrio furnissii CIP 102972]